MGFLKRIAALFMPTGNVGDLYHEVSVKCNRCGEIVQSRIHLRNDLSIDYGGRPSDITYYCRKILMGEGRCFQNIEVELKFNRHYQVIEKRITGGQFVDPSDVE